MSSKDLTANPCAAIPRSVPKMEVNNDIAAEIGKNYRTLPTFEKALYEYTCTKNYSLRTNELLACRWIEYKSNDSHGKFTPFNFLDIRDYHFHNCQNRLIPAMSIHTKTDFRRKMKTGPGVDDLGEIPIPQELLLYRELKNEKKDKSTERKGVKKDPVEEEVKT